MNMLAQLFFDAASLGGVYAMAALGIALIFGVMNLVNFAHGQFIAFCVFAMIVPSTEAAAVMMFGNLPAVLLIAMVLALLLMWQMPFDFVLKRRPI
jgi:branched-chain amino acid transport system permease protein